MSSSSNKAKILSWNPIAYWKWDVNTNNCNICRSHIMNSCVECLNNPLDESCKVVTGTCGCSYHFHCINNWLKSKNHCPSHINLEWEYHVKS